MFDALNAICAQVFGMSFDHQPLVGPTQSGLNGILRDNDETKTDKTVFGILWVVAEDFITPPKKNDTIVISGKNYLIRSEPDDVADGQGGLNLRLRAK